MSAVTQLTTAAELLAMPDEGFRYELVKGELRRMAPAGDDHGYVAMNFGSLLTVHVKANNLGRVYAAETGFRLASDPDTVRAPDVAFVGRNRIEGTGKIKGYRSGSPNLAVEVVSPGDTFTKVDEKAIEWLNAGALMVLVL